MPGTDIALHKQVKLWKKLRASIVNGVKRITVRLLILVRNI